MIVATVPITMPLIAQAGYDPVWFGVLVVLLMEASLLTPPIGMNLFLAASRFERPIMAVARSVLPFGLVLLIVLLVVTYVPALTLALVR